MTVPQVGQPFANNTILTHFQELVIACKRGDISAIERILNAIPQLAEEKDSDGNTPLLIACKEKQNEVILKLIEIANPDLDAQNPNNESALLILANNYQANPCDKIIAKLIAKGANPKLAGESEILVLNSLIKSWNIPDYFSVLQKVLHMGFDLNQPDALNRLPLLVALCDIPDQELRKGILIQLIKYGASPNYNLLCLSFRPEDSHVLNRIGQNESIHEDDYAPIPHIKNLELTHVISALAKRNPGSKLLRQVLVEVFEMESLVKADEFLMRVKKYERSELEAFNIMMEKIFVADKTCNYLMLTQAIAKCVKDYGLGLQEIEALLRMHECRTFILARTPDERDPECLEINSMLPKKYKIFVSTYQKEVLLDELLEQSKNYAENFEKLSEVGFCVERPKSKRLQSKKKSAANNDTANLREADQKYQEIFALDKAFDSRLYDAIYKCMITHKVTLQEIELALRMHRCNTHLVTRNAIYPLIMDAFGNKVKYEYALVDCWEEANKIIVGESGSYRENFLRLKDAGLPAGPDQQTKRVNIDLENVVNSYAEETVKGIQDKSRVPAPKKPSVAKLTTLKPAFDIFKAFREVKLSAVSKHEFKDSTLTLTFHNDRDCEFAASFFKKDRWDWFKNVEKKDLQLLVTINDNLEVQKKQVDRLAANFNHALRKRDAKPQPSDKDKNRNEMPAGGVGTSSTTSNIATQEEPIRRKTPRADRISKSDLERERIQALIEERNRLRELGKSSRKTKKTEAASAKRVRHKSPPTAIKNEAVQNTAETKAARGVATKPNGSPPTAIKNAAAQNTTETKAVEGVVIIPNSSPPTAIKNETVQNTTETKAVEGVVIIPNGSPPTAFQAEGGPSKEGVAIKKAALADDRPIVTKRSKRKRKFTRDQVLRLASAEASARNACDLWSRVKSDVHDLKKPEVRAWVSHALQQHLMQLCEALQPTAKGKKEEQEIDDHEKKFKEILSQRFMDPDDIRALRNLLRSSFVKTPLRDIFELAEKLHLFAENKNDKTLHERLQEIGKRESQAFSIRECHIFQCKWRIKKHPRRNYLLLREIPKRIKVLRNVVADCLQEFQKIHDYEYDRCSAIRNLITHVAWLISKLKPYPKIFVESPVIIDLRILANFNVHEIKTILKGGGESEAIKAKEIFQRLADDPSYLAAIESLIQKAIEREKKVNIF